jgi:hypothetical protein
METSGVSRNFIKYSSHNRKQDNIDQDPSMHGCMLIPLGAGSDKTTVSVATGHQEYHPVYVMPGNITNIVHQAHGNSVLPASFLPIPKGKSVVLALSYYIFFDQSFSALKRQHKTVTYQRFVRQMYHACLALIFELLKAGTRSCSRMPLMVAVARS